MADLQVEAKALGDATRHAIFRFIADSDSPVGVAELTAHLGLNHNGIRQHLAKLVEAGLVDEFSVPTGGRGRPRLQYKVDPGAESRWAVVGPYERLSGWLAEIVRTGDSPREVGRRVGFSGEVSPMVPSSDGDPSAPRPDDPVVALVERMAQHGFEPELSTDGDAFEVILDACPFESTALAAPEAVCELHLGLAEGIAASVEGIQIDELVAKDPRRAGCRLRAHVTPLEAPKRRTGSGRARLRGRGAER